MKIFYTFFLFIFLFPDKCLSQDTAGAIHLGELPPEGIVLDKGWKFHAGDNPEWAKPGLDDSRWQRIDPTLDIMNLPQVRKPGIGWFRLRIRMDSSAGSQALVLLVTQVLASEIYIDGRMIRSFGNISSNKHEVRAYNPIGQQVSLPRNGNKELVLSVRYAFQQDIPYFRIPGLSNSCLFFQLIKENDVDRSSLTNIVHEVTIIETFRAGLFFVLAFLHLAFFIAYPIRKANLYFSATALCFFLNSLSGLVFGQLIHSFKAIEYLRLFIAPFYPLGYFFLITALYVVYGQKSRLLYILLTIWLVITLVILFTNYEDGNQLAFFSTVLLTLEAIRMTILATLRRQQGAKIILAGMAYSFVAFSLFFLYYYNHFSAT